MEVVIPKKAGASISTTMLRSSQFTYISLRASHDWKDINEMLFRLLGKVIDVRPEQYMKTIIPMLVTPSGIVIVSRLEQP